MSVAKKMTIDEAITELKKHISPYTNCKADANDAIDMAIKSLKALEQIEEYAKANWNGDRDIRDYIRRQLRHLSE